MKRTLLLLFLFFVCRSIGLANNLVHGNCPADTATPIISFLQYWFDNDTISTYETNFKSTGWGSSIEDSIETDALSVGMHTLHLCVVDNNDIKSSPISYTFFKTKPIISQYEYWYDNGAVSKGSLVGGLNNVLTLDSSFATNALTDGLHTFNIRFRDSAGIYSTTKTSYFYKTTPFISYYEYWFDDDLSTKMGTSVSPKANLQIMDSLSFSGYKQGIHKITFRARNANGTWTSPYSSYFVIAGAPAVTAYQYWFDSDIASAVNQTISGGKLETSLSQTLATNGLTVGYHLFNIRFKDAAGGWSSVQTSSFIKLSDGTPNEVTAYRYWFDDDFDNAISKAVSSGNAQYNLDKTISPGSLSGTHYLNIQFQDKGGVWSSVYTDTISLTPAQLISYSPAYGCPATVITIKGNNLTGATSVLFGNTTASFTVVSDSVITTTVPATAASGTITIATPNGTIYSKYPFIVGKGLMPIAYVANYKKSNLSVVNTLTNSLIGTMQAGKEPVGVCISPDGDRIYVANTDGQSVYVFNYANFSLIDTFAVTSYPKSIRTSPDGSLIYVLNVWSNTVTVHKATDYSVLNTFYTGHAPNDLCINSKGTRIYVTNQTDNTVSVLDLVNYRSITKIPVGNGPHSVCVSLDDRYVYVSNEWDSTICAINTATNKMEYKVKVGAYPRGICTNQDGSLLYVVNGTDDNISVINTATRKEVRKINLVKNCGAEGLVISPDDAKLYMTNLDSTLTVYIAQTGVLESRTRVLESSFTTGNFINFLGKPCIKDPIITSFQPSIASQGTTVIIKGQNFITTSNVSFGGVSANSYVVINDTTIKAVVGAGATGSVSVITDGGIASLAGFKFCVPTSSTTITSVCSTALPFSWNNKSYNAAGTYTTILTNSVGCDSIATLVLSLNTPLTPTISINATATTVIMGTSVTITANTINGGTTPFYQWIKNGVNINGATSATYTTSTLANNDTISCLVTSNLSCVTVAQASSNKLVITVNTATYFVSGSLKNPIGKRISIPNIKINGTSTIIGDLSGNYSFIANNGSNITIRPSKNNDSVKNNGVSVIDAILVQSHVLNKSILNSPYKIIAADVNNSGDVSAIDILFIKRLALGIDTTFAGKKLWAFADSAYQFPDVTNPFPYKDSISINNLTANLSNQSFVGMKLGDVNYDWDATVMGNSTKRNTPIEFYYPNVQVENNAEIKIPIRVKSFRNILGMQYTLNFNSKVLELKRIEQNKLNVEYGINRAKEGKISFLWNDEKGIAKTLADSSLLMELVFTKKTLFTKEDLTLGNDIASIEAWDGNLQKHAIVKTSGIIQQKQEAIVAKESWEVAPNPTVDGKVKVSINLQSTKEVSLKLTSIDGKVLMQQKQIGKKGLNIYTINLESQMKLAKGVYYIQANGIEGEKAKVIVIE